MADSAARGRTLKEMRQAESLTQKQLAERIGVSKAAVSAWERGIAAPDEDNLEALSRTFRTTKAALRYGTENVHAGDLAPDRSSVERPLPRVANSHAIRVWLKEFELDLVRAGASEELVRDAMGLVTSPNVFTWYAGTGTKPLSEEDAIEALEALATVTRATYSKRFGLRFTDTRQR